MLAHGDGDGFAAVGGTDLHENGGDVFLYALLPEAKLFGDVGVGEPARHRFEYLQLARRKLLGGRVFGEKLLNFV